MKTLILLRHAKSSWSEPGLSDHDRPLNKRGRAAAPEMARWLAAQELIPQRTLCSTARRTQETVARMRKAVPALPEPEHVPALYLAEPATMLRLIRTLPNKVGSVMLVAHEPGLSSLAALLDNGSPAPGCARAFAHFPTAAVAVFRVDDGWAAFTPGGARFTAFAAPRDVASG